MKRLRLGDLAESFPHIPPECGTAPEQAIVVCLDSQGHPSGCLLTVEGEFTDNCKLVWSLSLTESMRRYWSDLVDATEQGAYGLAILLLRMNTGLTIIERSRRGTGFNWWLGTEDNLFQHKARLEVSGILSGSRRRFNSRLKAKLAQAEQSASPGLPVYAVVIEFRTPRAK
jgi:hypothetical protein